MTGDELAERGVEAVAISFVDNAGISRAKSVPARKLEQAATRGVGSPQAFSVFQGDDMMATSTGYEATGETRLIPDVDRLVEGLDGWGWAPGDLFDPEGEPWEFCSRSFLKRQVARLQASGFDMKMAYEHEWYAERDDGAPAHSTPAYSLNSTAEAVDYMREVLRRLDAYDVPVEQIHPEYSAGQMEISVGTADPLRAADDCVAARHAIRSAWGATGVRASFSPLPRLDGLGNGCHLHFSLWRGGDNLMGSGPDDELGATPEARSFIAGVLREIRALAALGCASPISYRRLAPNRWTGAYVCWGTENREAPIRFIRGSKVARPAVSNAELKTLDHSANPYLLAGAILAAGLGGLEDGLELPDPVQIEPSRVADELGLELLPASLEEAADALEASALLREALNPRLLEAIVDVRRGEAATTADRTDEDLFGFYRWRY